MTHKRRPGRPKKQSIPEINWNNSTISEKIIIIKWKINNYFSAYRNKIIIIFWLSIIIITLPVGIFIGRKTYAIDDYMSPKYSYMEKIGHLHKSWRAYRSLKPHELHIQWLKFLQGYTYQRGGDPIMGQLDCLRSLVLFLRSRGANFEVATIDILARRFQIMAELDYTTLKGEVRTGDIIVFRPIYYPQYGPIAHIGLVQEVCGNKIKYMDFSPLGVGFPTINRGDGRIHMIAEMSFPIWAGLALKK